MLATAEALAAIGVQVRRFNFPYRERGAKIPDPMPKLRERFAAEADAARSEARGRPLILGGRSMGGRVATMLAAEGFACDALLLFAYPLHPAGKPEKRRDAHLARIDVPVLCLNGTRDPLCSRELMEQTLARLGASWTMHWLDGADHSFHVLKSSGRRDDEVMNEVGDAAAHWVAMLKR